jgi:hypothetical protein
VSFDKDPCSNAHFLKLCTIESNCSQSGEVCSLAKHASELMKCPICGTNKDTMSKVLAPKGIISINLICPNPQCKHHSILDATQFKALYQLN